MQVLVLGSTGQTGYQVVKQLLENDIPVKTIARTTDKFASFDKNGNLQVIKASILDMADNSLKEILADIDFTICCLGHNISLKGIWGKPHFLVTEALKKIHLNTDNKGQTKKLILMSTTACLNDDKQERFSFGEEIVMGIMRCLLPPQRDNEEAVKFLKSIDQGDHRLEWIAVRPDTLVAEEQVTNYEIFESPQKSPVFNAGKTSRINVAHFMMQLVCNDELWTGWKYKMPVIYNVKEQTPDQ